MFRPSFLPSLHIRPFEASFSFIILSIFQFSFTSCIYSRHSAPPSKLSPFFVLCFLFTSFPLFPFFLLLLFCSLRHHHHLHLHLSSLLHFRFFFKRFSFLLLFPRSIFSLFMLFFYPYSLLIPFASILCSLLSSQTLLSSIFSHFLSICSLYHPPRLSSSLYFLL